MKKNILLISFLLISVFYANNIFAYTISSTYKYAWSNQIGWINFNPSEGSVVVSDTEITGYAWSPNFGWINLSPAQSGVKNSSTGQLSGYAWGENVGWIDFSGVKIDCSGQFTGTATGDVVGTISFTCGNCSVIANWNPTSGCGGGTSSGAVFMSHNECDENKQCVSVSGYGLNSCNGDSDCKTTHNECGGSIIFCHYGQCSGAQCVVVDGFGVDQCAVNSDCVEGVYNICNENKQCITIEGIGENSCLTNSDCQSVSSTYLRCENNKCISASGNLPDECSVDTDCTETIKKHNECNEQKQCVSVVGEGADLCKIDSDCYITHYECNYKKECVLTDGAGVNQCRINDDCGIGKHNECTEKKQCVSMNGEGVDQCETDADCGGESTSSSGGGGGGGSSSSSSSSGGTTVVEKIMEITQKNIVILAESVFEKVKEIINIPQVSTTAKTVTTAGAVAGAVSYTSIFFQFSFFDIFLSPFRLFNLVLMAWGIKKRVLPWGVVYDAVTKRPLDPAYVTLKNMQGIEVASAITDMDGRYGFLVGPGTYKILAKKTNYLFPSKKIESRIGDEFYTNVYFGETIEIKRAGDAITKNIPLDPLKFDWNEFAKKDKKLMKFYSKWDFVFERISDIFFAIGYVVAIISYLFVPEPYNTIVMIVYLILLLARVFGFKMKSLGSIKDKNNNEPLSFAILKVFMPSTNVEIARKVANKYGKYYCLVPSGKYYVKIEKKNRDGSYTLIYTSPVIDVTKTGIIKERFKV